MRKPFSSHKGISNGNHPLEFKNGLEKLKLEDILPKIEELPQPPSIEKLLIFLRKCKLEKHFKHVNCLYSYLHNFGLETHSTLGNYIVPMLAEVGSVWDAKNVFDRLVNPNEHSWNSLITGFINHGHSDHAFIMFQRMREGSVQPNGYTYVALTRACASQKDLNRGVMVHRDIVARGLERDLFVGSSLVDMYGKHGKVIEAQNVFDRLTMQDAVSWNALIAGYLNSGFANTAIDCYRKMQEYITPTSATFVCSLKACGKMDDLKEGQNIHSKITADGFPEEDMHVGNALIDMYASCGSLVEAEFVFQRLPQRDKVSWTSLIWGYSKHNLHLEVLCCFSRMMLQNVFLSDIAYVCCLKACNNLGYLGKGLYLHDAIIRGGILEDHLVGTALVDMYANSGMLTEAQKVFNKLSCRDIVSWTALIAGYAKYGNDIETLETFKKMQLEGISPDAICWNALIEGFLEQGHATSALNCFERMQMEGVSPDNVTFVFSLKACMRINSSSKVQELHSEMEKRGPLERNMVVINSLLDSYVNCGLLDEAADVFRRIQAPDVVSWTTLLSGYVNHGLAKEALKCLEKMRSMGVPPSIVTFVCILKSCGSSEMGQEIHSEIEKKGLLGLDITIGNALIDMYASFGLLMDAENVFDALSCRDVVSWTALVAGYARHGHSEEAMDCFETMRREGIIPDVVTWSALISGNAKHEYCEEALTCLEMMKLEGVDPDAITFASSLKACGSRKSLCKGQEIHAEMVMKGFLEHDLVVGNALVDMYASCGSLIEAQDSFDRILVRDVVSWTALIAGFTKYGFGEEAILLFEEMQKEGFCADVVTYICILKACGNIGATNKGEEIHKEIANNQMLHRNPLICNALLEMYTNAGLLDKAQEVFDTLPTRDAVLWTSLISGYAKHGCTEVALSCFEQMQLKGVSPDEISWNALIAGYARLGEMENVFHVIERMTEEGMIPCVDTFTSVLSACSHAGDVDMGYSYFQVMSNAHGLTSTIEHHVCMVDLLGRAGQLDKVVLVIKEMPHHPNLVAWHTILGACRKWGHIVAGKWAFKQALGLDHRDASSYISMFNIYADAGMYSEAKKIEELRIGKQAIEKIGEFLTKQQY